MTKKKSSIQLVFKEKSEPYTFEKHRPTLPFISSSQPQKKSYKHLTPAILAALASVWGVAKFMSNHSKRAEKNGRTTPSAHVNNAPNPSESIFVPVPELPPIDPLELIPVESNTVSNQLFSQIQSVAPQGTTTNQLWQYTALLQKLSTDTNGVCKAVDMPRQSFTNFVNSVQYIPTNELNKAISNTSTNQPLYSFQALSDALTNSPSNTYAVAQEAFLLSRHYQVHDLFTREVPTYEGDKDFIYWDSVGIPTVGKGINLVANANALSWLRIKNSEKLRKLLSDLPDDEYVTLTSAQLSTLTKDVNKNGLVGKGANEFKTRYGLSVHPDDLPRLDTYFHKKVSTTLKRVERELEGSKPAKLANESVLFGSYVSTNQVPLRAVETVLDIGYNTGNNIRASWTNLTQAIESRDFLKAKSECTVQKVQESRNEWHKDNMQDALDEWQELHPPRNRAPNAPQRSVR